MTDIKAEIARLACMAKIAANAFQVSVALSAYCASNDRFAIIVCNAVIDGLANIFINAKKAVCANIASLAGNAKCRQVRGLKQNR